MSGAIPRSLMTDAELRDLAHDTGEDDLFIPTPAGLAAVGVSQHRLPTSFAGHGENAAGKSTGADLHRKAGSVPRETHRDLGGPACSPAATVSATTATSS